MIYPPNIEGTDNTNVITGGVFGTQIGLPGETVTLPGTVVVAGLTASSAVATDANSNLASSSTTSTELGYVHGVTSAIQTQLGTLQTNINAKAPSASPVFTGLVEVASHAKGSLPSATAVGQVIYVTDATGAHVTGSLCFSNATGASNWIDVTTGVAVA